jgi:hypothetical protein
MGWGSAVDIFDITVEAAFEMLGETTVGDDNPQDTIELMRPFVAKLAQTFSDLDWDTQEESEYFRMFPKEIAPNMAEEDYWWNLDGNL